MPQVAELIITITMSIDVEVMPGTQPIEPPVSGNDVTLQWNIPTERENGSPLDLNDIAGYEVVYQLKDETAHTVSVAGGEVNSLQLDGLTPGSYTYKVRAVDVDGKSNQFSVDAVSVVN